MIFEYKVKTRHRLGWKEFKLYADTDIEEFFNRNSIDYVRNATDTVENRLFKENKRLNNIINELNNAYCKVITKCEEMIGNRFYMNDNAIKKYADEIKDICKYYVGEAKELKGEDKE